MGNKSSSVKNDGNNHTLIHPYVSSTKQINHPILKDAQILPQSNTMKIALPPIFMGTIQQWKDAYKKLKLSEPQFLLLPNSYKLSQKTGYCGGEIYPMELTYELTPYSLMDQIEARRKLKKMFQEDEIWYLLFVLSDSSKRLLEKGQKAGDIRPHNIMFNQRGVIKLVNFFSWPNQKTNYEKSLQQLLPTYLSPQQISIMTQNQDTDTTNTQKSQSFSIGLTMLSILYLQDLSHLYKLSQKQKSLNIPKLNQYLSHHLQTLNYLNTKNNRIQKYSKSLIDVIKHLCYLDQIQRLNIIKVYQWLIPYKSKIINLRAVEINSDQICLMSNCGIRVASVSRIEEKFGNKYDQNIGIGGVSNNNNGNSMMIVQQALNQPKVKKQQSNKTKNNINKQVNKPKQSQNNLNINRLTHSQIHKRSSSTIPRRTSGITVTNTSINKIQAKSKQQEQPQGQVNTNDINKNKNNKDKYKDKNKDKHINNHQRQQSLPLHTPTSTHKILTKQQQQQPNTSRPALTPNYTYNYKPRQSIISLGKSKSTHYLKNNTFKSQLINNSKNNTNNNNVLGHTSSYTPNRIQLPKYIINSTQLTNNTHSNSNSKQLQTTGYKQNGPYLRKQQESRYINYNNNHNYSYSPNIPVNPFNVIQGGNNNAITRNNNNIDNRDNRYDRHEWTPLKQQQSSSSSQQQQQQYLRTPQSNTKLVSNNTNTNTNSTNNKYKQQQQQQQRQRQQRQRQRQRKQRQYRQYKQSFIKKLQSPLPSYPSPSPSPPSFNNNNNISKILNPFNILQNTNTNNNNNKYSNNLNYKNKNILDIQIIINKKTLLNNNNNMNNMNNNTLINSSRNTNNNTKIDIDYKNIKQEYKLKQPLKKFDNINNNTDIDIDMDMDDNINTNISRQQYKYIPTKVDININGQKYIKDKSIQHKQGQRQQRQRQRQRQRYGQRQRQGQGQMQSKGQNNIINTGVFGIPNNTTIAAKKAYTPRSSNVQYIDNNNITNNNNNNNNNNNPYNNTNNISMNNNANSNTNTNSNMDFSIIPKLNKDYQYQYQHQHISNRQDQLIIKIQNVIKTSRAYHPS